MKLKTKGPLFWIISVFGLLIVGWLYVMLLKSPCDLQETAYLNIYPGDTQEKVMQTFQKVGKAHSTKKLEFLLNLVNYKENVKPGQYALKPGISPFRIVRVLRSGLQTPVKLTFNNIRTVEELAGRLSSQLMTDSLTLLKSFKETAWRDSLQLTDQNYMSVFIPDTYEVWWNISPQKLRGKFIKAWNDFWDETRLKEASKIGLTQAQVSTLASIVEEETKQSDEMPKVAGLYLNRMRIDMPLQADPTVKFAVGDFTIKRILRAHTLINSPYNTYKVIGLPPGPIRIPSIRALDATLQPNRHSYLYMCAKSDFSGYHAFATTYEQHEANAVKYRMELNKHGIMR
ncbi:MAG TPA: endolytic transglycosylase MltG [Bacteroidales bacterium]|nr:endolytic transglycosylase MltG [Bacteroidales bacterium]